MEAQMNKDNVNIHIILLSANHLPHLPVRNHHAMSGIKLQHILARAWKYFEISKLFIANYFTSIIFLPFTLHDTRLLVINSGFGSRSCQIPVTWRVGSLADLTNNFLLICSENLILIKTRDQHACLFAQLLSIAGIILFS